MNFGCPSEIGSLQKILLKHPRESFINQENIDRQWEKLHYLDRPDFQGVMKEYEAFESCLKKFSSQLFYLPGDNVTGLDSVYIRDPLIMINQGAILGNMGKTQRLGEPASVAKFLESLHIPIIGTIAGDGTLEAGDVVVWDTRTIMVGHSYRTNCEGIRQFRELAEDYIEEFITVPLPHWRGPDDILHLMSLISPIDHDLAVVYPPLLPVSFLEWMDDRGVRMIQVPDSEFSTMACNILTLAPRRCVMIAGNPETRKKLEFEGVEVMEFPGEELCKKGGGGPTCLTRPLHRSV